jgi:hypothetical protein
MDGCKRPVPFEEWDSFFASNPNVLVNAVVRATSYKGKKFVQVVPTSILEINLEAIADNENDLDFFEI